MTQCFPTHNSKLITHDLFRMRRIGRWRRRCIRRWARGLLLVLVGQRVGSFVGSLFDCALGMAISSLRSLHGGAADRLAGVANGGADVLGVTAGIFYIA